LTDQYICGILKKMARSMYSLEQVADELGLHVRTVRNHVRSGRLKAVRIGKQYRVARRDLEAITGPVTAQADDVIPRRRRVVISSVVEIDAVSKDTATRVATQLLGPAKTNRDDDSSLRVEAIYDEARGSMKIIVIGALPAAGDLFRLLDITLDA
jgi:excisionase family DNA binding protein